MIVDCHTHVWESPEQLGRAAKSWDAHVRARTGTITRASKLRAGKSDHLAAAQPVNHSIVLGLKSHYLEADIPNDYIAHFVQTNRNKLIGFAGIDPSRPKEAINALKKAHDELGLQGVTIGPAMQDFHPACSAAMRVYAEINRLQLPVLFHQDLQVSDLAKMEFARPYLIDEVAREFPDMKIIIGQMGYPWVEETIALLSKHRHIFAEISGLLHRPWQAYNTLLSAYQAEVMDGLLFGSNFPYSTAAACIEQLYSINHFCHGTNLPTIPREQLRQIVERDALSLLGIEVPRHSTPVTPSNVITGDD